jgi:hypothetical protein
LTRRAARTEHRPSAILPNVRESDPDDSFDELELAIPGAWPRMIIVVGYFLGPAAWRSTQSWPKVQTTAHLAG